MAPTIIETPLNEEPTTEQLEKLCAEASSVAKKAYAAYSNFHVGAAILTKEGEIFSGCNFENASYGLAICAERSAIGKVISSCPSGALNNIQAVVVTTSDRNVFIPPCGACRQVLSEFGNYWVYMLRADGKVARRHTVNQLLPFRFEPDDMAVPAMTPSN